MATQIQDPRDSTAVTIISERPRWLQPLAEFPVHPSSFRHISVTGNTAMNCLVTFSLQAKAERRWLVLTVIIADGLPRAATIQVQDAPSSSRTDLSFERLVQELTDKATLYLQQIGVML